VTTYNVNDYMPAGLIEIRRKLQETVEFTRTLDGNQRKALAESWIRKAPTYAYDGSGLVFVSDVPAGSDPVAHNLTYTFTSSHAGYGNRTGAVTDQVITEHSITLTLTYDGIVQSAVIDGTWDEIGQYLIGSEVSLHYQPMQCEKMPWQVWEENSGRVYIRAPTDEEIITHYYQAVYDIGVGKVQKLEPGIATCQACSVCPETYRFVLTVDADRMHVLLDEGWMRGASGVLFPGSAPFGDHSPRSWLFGRRQSTSTARFPCSTHSGILCRGVPIHRDPCQREISQR